MVEISLSLPSIVIDKTFGTTSILQLPFLSEWHGTAEYEFLLGEHMMYGNGRLGVKHQNKTLFASTVNGEFTQFTDPKYINQSPFQCLNGEERLKVCFHTISSGLADFPILTLEGTDVQFAGTIKSGGSPSDLAIAYMQLINSTTSYFSIIDPNKFGLYLDLWLAKFSK